MATLNQIGLEQEKAQELAHNLNNLLANFQLYYQNTRALHWNIKGANFFELHVKFEELYTDAQEKVDMIAERILTLGHTPAHSFSEYLELGQLTEAKNIFEDSEAVSKVVADLGSLLTIERELLEQANGLGDEGTESMLSDFITEQEKTVWMFSAWLNQ